MDKQKCVLKSLPGGAELLARLSLREGNPSSGATESPARYTGGTGWGLHRNGFLQANLSGGTSAGMKFNPFGPRKASDEDLPTDGGLSH